MEAGEVKNALYDKFCKNNSMYFRLKVPERKVGGSVEGGFEVVLSRLYIRFVKLRGDGAAYVYVGEEMEPFFVYEDEAWRLLSWLDNN